MDALQSNYLIPRPLTLDCFEEIIGYLIDDPGSLYSCLLVNRLWCRIAIPLLWSHPFEHYAFGESAADIIQIYISCLPEDERQFLIDEGLKLPPPSSPLFDYPKYLQSFESARFTGAVMSWLSSGVKSWLSLVEEQGSDIHVDTYIIQTVIGSLLFSRSKGLKDLEIVYFDEDDDSLISDIISFDNAGGALSRLEKFVFDYSSLEEQGDKHLGIISNLFNFMSQCTRNIQDIRIDIDIPFDQDMVISEVAQSFARLIKAQKALKVLNILKFWRPEIVSFIFETLTSQTNTLTYLEVHELYQGQFQSLLDILPSLTNLETLQFHGFSGNDGENMKVNISATGPINIKHLHYKANKFQVDIFNLMDPLLQMAGGNLRTLSLECVTSEIVLLIGRNCPNLTHLSLSLTTQEIPESVSELLSSMTNLQHFSLYIYSSDPPFATTENLLQFSLSIPPSLLYFGFYLAITPYILEYFLRNCRAKLQVLTIHKYDNNLLPVITNYASEYGCLKKLLIDLDAYHDESSLSEIIEEAKKVIPIVDNIIETSYPFSGPYPETYVDLWNRNITVPS
ncbi:9802_t:CDS:2 [Acaulospora morrowiae]|uniref:9802_t:CDS:1 n=1 Tax=Acaulospora morrowiae TaxID=94023 RepID=A0A9N8ZSF8_9GLOM|nr:9802_t:CDS:2 [Acaulospora morrowiae]